LLTTYRIRIVMYNRVCIIDLIIIQYLSKSTMKIYLNIVYTKSKFSIYLHIRQFFLFFLHFFFTINVSICRGEYSICVCIYIYIYIYIYIVLSNVLIYNLHCNILRKLLIGLIILNVEFYRIPLFY